MLTVAAVTRGVMMQSPKWPDENYPSLEDYKFRNLSDEWKQYFADVLNMFSPWNQELILTWSECKQEAAKLLELLLSSNSMNEAEAYLKSNPPSTHLIIHLLMQHQKQSKLEGFETVRKKGADANKAKAKTNKAFILKTNSDLLVSIDWARKTLDDRAKYIAKQCETQRIKMANGKNYSESYIKKLITGN